MTEADIVKIVEDFYKVKYKDILTKSTQQYPIGIAKNIIVHLFRYELGMKWNEIADKFKTTERNIQYRESAFNKLIKQQQHFLNDYEEILNTLKEKD